MHYLEDGMGSDTVGKDSVSGFKGAVTGLPLSDVVQLKAHNHFSGCILVEYGTRRGGIFFQAGEVVHAELGEREGAEAFYAIMTWPGGRFDIQDGVEAKSRTIDMKLTHLLLEAHRLMDERRIEAPAEDQPAGEESQPRQRKGINSACARLMQISGVTYAVMFGPDGAPMEDGSSDALRLAEQGSVLVNIAARLGELFGVGSLKALARQDGREQQLLFEAKNVYITLAVSGGAQLSQVEADIRSTFAAKR